jgi:hypothetical protein
VSTLPTPLRRQLERAAQNAWTVAARSAAAKLPAIAWVPLVVDIERPFPAYAGGEPMRPVRRTSFADYLEEIRPRLNALEEEESEPKLILKVYEIWRNLEYLRGIFG